MVFDLFVKKSVDWVKLLRRMFILNKVLSNFFVWFVSSSVIFLFEIKAKRLVGSVRSLNVMFVFSVMRLGVWRKVEDLFFFIYWLIYIKFVELVAKYLIFFGFFKFVFYVGCEVKSLLVLWKFDCFCFDYIYCVFVCVFGM